MIVLLDASWRKNEAKLVLPAECAGAESINFMARHAKGLICLALTRQRCQELGLPLLRQVGEVPHDRGPAFTASIEAAEGVSTGISAADRALTIQRAALGTARDIVQPGHVFPVQAVDGGVLMRPGHTEAACDLAVMAGYRPAAAVCAILRSDGSVACAADGRAFARKHGLKLGHIDDLIVHRMRHEALVHKVATCPLQTHYGAFTAQAYREAYSNRLHMALIKGRWLAGDAVEVRIHDALSPLDILGISQGQSEADSLHATLRHMQRQSRGLAILLNCHEDSARAFQGMSQLARCGPDRPCGTMLAWQRQGVGLHILRDCQVGRPQFSRERLSLWKKGENGLAVADKYAPR